MRGADTFTESLFTMRHLDDFVPADHPLRVIRVMVNKALANMDELFTRMYAADIKGGRPPKGSSRRTAELPAPIQSTHGGGYPCFILENHPRASIADLVQKISGVPSGC